MNIRKSLALVVFLSTYALTAQVAQQPVATSDVEQAKWATLQTVFSTKLAGSKTFMNKLGSVMKNHARILVVGTMIGVGLMNYSELIGRALITDECHDAAQSPNMRSTADSTCSSSSSSSSQAAQQAFEPRVRQKMAKMRSSSDNDLELKTAIVAAVLVVLSCAEMLHYVYKKTGGWLEKEPLRCKNLLTDIAVHWQDYKAAMPVVLHPLFEKLADDTKVHGKLTLINDTDACKLVESVLAMAAVVEAAA